MSGGETDNPTSGEKSFFDRNSTINGEFNTASPKINTRQAIAELVRENPAATQYVIEVRSYDLPDIPMAVHDYVAVRELGSSEDLFQFHGLSMTYHPDKDEFELGDTKLFEENDRIKGFVITKVPGSVTDIMDDFRTNITDTHILFTGHPAETVPKILAATATLRAINEKDIHYDATGINSNSVAAEIIRSMTGNNQLPDLEGWEIGKDEDILTAEERANIQLYIYDREFGNNQGLEDFIIEELRAVSTDLNIDKVKADVKASVEEENSAFANMTEQERLEFPPRIMGIEGSQ